ncbi:lipoate--protein ligase [Guptibacillus algicola]|uniref:lipoate--protein ligase n=1 Tax=Guptibacillus algicola TaxID=225844 RepID=UPI001CD23FF1|nr:lipoate--protein ligase [Alkalihalobacillus algicola]MCA0989153.1 lipoate--protein ligase [Alkalihalobacillus algicola]
MRFIDNENIMDAGINLAIEEYILKELDPEETYLLFYSMNPTVIVGKNQNTIEQIDTTYTRENDVDVIRRLSGGGAVYNDPGNLSFSIITKDDGNSFHNYKKFTDPVVKALHKMGVDAELSGRNDLLVNGKKISGNAQFSTKGRMYSHGTLMFDVNLENVVKALKVNKEKIESKGIKSIRSRVTNISEHMDEDMTREEFKQKLLQSIFEEYDEVPTYQLTEEDWDEINRIADKRYKNWDWNYGRSPKFNVQHSKRFPIGSIDVRLEVKKGYIKQATIFGDFFGVGDVKELEERLTDTKYEPESIRDSLKGLDVKHYFGNISEEDFINLIY